MLEVACKSFLKFPLCVLSPLFCPWTPVHAQSANPSICACSASSSSFSGATTGRQHFFLADFLWGLRLKENKSGNLGVNVLGESLTKGLLALWDGSYQGCIWKTFIVLLRKPDFQVKVWPAIDNIYIILIAFGQQIAFGNLGIIVTMQGHMQKKLYIVKKKQLKCDSVQLLNVATLPCLSPCSC